MATRTKAELEAALAAGLAANNTGAITPSVHRALLQDILDSGPNGIAGSDVLTGVQWVDGLGWQAVSDVQTQYLAVTAVDDFDTLRRALVQHLTAGGNENELANIPAFISIRTSSYISVGGAATSGRDANLADLWPLNADAPFVWLLSPVRYGWLDRGRVNVSTRVDNANADPHLEPLQRFGATAYRITINGVPYDVGRYHTGLARPVDVIATPNEAALRFQYRFSAAPAGAHVVEQIP